MNKNKNIKTWLFYALLLFSFGIIAYFFIRKGQGLDVLMERGSKTLSDIDNGNSDSFIIFKTNTLKNLEEPAGLLLLQLIAILAVSRIVGFLFMKMKQPTVIGEILAGIMLGPSLLGYFFPDVFQFLFNPNSLDYLYILSQIGLILFMFTIGMDLDIDDLRKKLKDTFVISHSSIIIPFVMGIILAYIVYRDFSTPDSTFLSFSLFIGISMSITAFPVLARIIQEKGLTKTHLGTLTIASAANNDVTAWILLVAVIAIAQTGSFTSSIYTLLFSAGYIAVMLAIIRPFLKKIGNIYQNEELFNKSIFAFFILILIISAYTTQLLGIHALFGAFLAGVIMPPLPKFRKLMIDKVEDISVSLLLPLFFVYTGLRTQIGLVNTPQLWMLTGVFILVAIIGKLGGSAIPARIIGENWKDSLSLGALMNTRGLMELIVLNIGLEMGIIPPTIFVILVIMALVTTFITTPLLSVIEKIFPEKQKQEQISKEHALGVFKALIALGNPQNGSNLLRVAKTILNGAKNSLAVNVLHITAGTNVNPIYGEQFSVDSFLDVKAEAGKLNIPITTEYKVSDNVESEIIHTVNEEEYDFLLIGAGQALINTTFFEENSPFAKMKWLNHIINKITNDKTLFYPGTLIRDKTKYFIEQSSCSVGVFVNKNFTKITNILIVLSEIDDEFLLRYAKRILNINPEITVQVIDIHHILEKNKNSFETLNSLVSQFPQRVKISKITKLHSGNVNRYSFMMVSYPAWEHLIADECKALNDIPSTLIINKKKSRFNPKNASDNNLYMENTDFLDI